MNKSMRVSFVILLIFVFVVVFLERTNVDGLNGETGEHLTETHEVILLNGGKFRTEMTPIVDTGWTGASCEEKEFLYQPPAGDGYEFVGRGRGRSNKALSHVNGDRILITYKNALFLRSAQGVWQEIDWTYRKFPGRESQAARFVLDQRPNHEGYFQDRKRRALSRCVECPV